MIDVVMPAVLRPELLERTLSSFRKNLLTGAISQYRFTINIDSVGAGSVGEVEAVVRRHFKHVRFRTPEIASLNAAIRWLWAQVESDLAVYLEDDIICLRPVDLEAMMAAMRADETWAYLQVPYRSFKTETEHSDHNVQHRYVGEGIHERQGKYAMTLQPGVMRREFMYAVAAGLKDHPDPELQLHPNGGLGLLTRRGGPWRFGTFAKPGDSQAIEDIGIHPRQEANWKKLVLPTGTTWRPVGTFPLGPRKVPIRALDCEFGGLDWNDAAAGRWRRKSFEIIDRAVRPGDWVVDVGAYVGAFTLYLASTVGPVGRVLAVEPEPLSHEILANNIKLNPDLKEQIWLTDKAAGRTDASAEFGPGPGGWGSSRSSLLFGGRVGDIVVHCLPLGKLLQTYHFKRIDYLKIIVQGAEPDILEGAVDVIKQEKPTLHITVQPHLYADRAEGLRRVVKVLGLYQHLYNESGQPVQLTDLTRNWPDNDLYIKEIALVATDREWESLRD